MHQFFCFCDLLSKTTNVTKQLIAGQVSFCPNKCLVLKIRPLGLQVRRLECTFASTLLLLFARRPLDTVFTYLTYFLVKIEVLFDFSLLLFRNLES
ncbi:hypothetical protein L596_019778 [Steinernema carpocapsae]|uniref:Uncharacterized protein n=1 Tax=Steinernema carpocapsae TaxID=34508 RepID=A0A4U5MRJ7_STECR|nr:hypothetical protein L596_019778 [Steinernema carpocapsae]